MGKTSQRDSSHATISFPIATLPSPNAPRDNLLPTATLLWLDARPPLATFTKTLPNATFLLPIATAPTAANPNSHCRFLTIQSPAIASSKSDHKPRNTN